MTDSTSEPQPPTNSTPQHPLLRIATHLFPNNPSDAIYLSLNRSIQVDVYYNAEKVALQEWGFQLGEEKMRVWLQEWWVNRVLNGNIWNQSSSDSSPEQQQEENEENDAAENAAAVTDANNATTQPQQLSPTQIMQIWKDFILPYSSSQKQEVTETTETEPKKDKKASKKASKQKEEQQEESKPKAPLYNIDDVRLMTEYLSNSLFQFSDLYQFVFSTSPNQQSTTEEKFYHIMQEPMRPDQLPPMNEFMEMEAYEEKQKEEEQKQAQLREEKQKAEEEKIRIARQEREERERKEREEREAPRLSSEQLAEIASFLKYHLNKDLTQKEESILGRMQELQHRLEKQEEESRPGSAAAKKKKK